jgi:excinuclease ABC subunit A
VLDEPTIGLHPQDVERLTDALLELARARNTVLAVEHDTGIMRRADWIVDMGPARAPGRRGRRVGHAGRGHGARDVAHRAALRGEISLARKSQPREGPREVVRSPARGCTT